MTGVRVAALVTAFLIAAGEVARYWGKPAFVPMAFDELAVAGALTWGAIAARRQGAGLLLAAWGGFCGLMLVLLVQNADHLINARPKANAWLYVTALSALLLLGLWAVRRSLAALRIR